MEALGRLIDVVAGVAPVDLDTANGATGNRVHLKNAGGCTIVVFKGAGTAGADPTFDLRQHTAASGGTSADLDVIDHYYLKREASLDGDETWSRFTQAAASEVADPGGAGTSAEEQQILVIEVEATSLADGFEWISLDVAVTAANPQLGAVLYLLRDLEVQRAPANLANPQA
jgi:hypothetical protein